MERIVSNGYRDCTALLDGTECKVMFDHCYRAFAVMNDSTEDVFVSIEQGKSSGEDGVRRIAPGCSSVLAHMRTDIDTVYVTGSGSVQIAAQNGTENPFKPQSGGGDLTINGNVVTPSAVNGNIKIDGAEYRVYDDTDIKEQLADIGSGVSPTVVENEDNTDELYRLDITDVNGTFTTPNLIGKTGAQGIQGAKGEKGDTGEQGLQGIQGIKGDKGDDGYPFLIYKEYSSLDEFDAAHFPEIGLMFMVKTGENFPVYRYTGDADTPYSFVTELATSEGIKGEKGDKGDTGEQGIQGEAGKDGADGTTYIPSIGTVESAETASVSVEVNEETKQAVFNFGLPKGADGADGEKAVQFTPVITEENELAWENDGGLENPPTVPIQQILSNAPIGTVLSFAGSTAPKGYLVCDGQSVAVADYPELYAVIGNIYGGDETNFNVPNLVDKFIQGSTASGTEKEAGLPNIEGKWLASSVYTPYFEGTFEGAFSKGADSQVQSVRRRGSDDGNGANMLKFDASRSNAIYGNSDTVQPPALTMVYIIKAKYEGVEIETNGITVDSTLSSTSTNPVQNKAIVEALADKANLSDIPIELPADGGNADTAKGTTTTILCYGDNPNTILDWANSTNSNSHSFVIAGYGVPSDSPFSEEAVISSEGDNSDGRKVITWKSYTSTKILQRRIWQGAWQTEWYNPANGCNADTVDGLHADDFVKSGKEQIEIPSGVDVPVWIYNNGKRYTVYRTVGVSNGYTNLPNNSTDYVWYIYNGNFIFAYINSEHRLYVCDTINGVFSGWQATFTSRHMPYATGTVSISYNSENGGAHKLEVLDFTPSFVICHHTQDYNSNGVLVPAIPITNGFKITVAQTTVTSVDYIAFR